MLESTKDIVGYFMNATMWLVRKTLTEKKLSQKIIIDLCSGSRAIGINCGEQANIRVWMNIRNYTPFEQKLDNLTAIYYHGGVSIKLRSDKRYTIKPFSEEDVYLNENVTTEQAKNIALAECNGTDPRLEYHTDFSNRLYQLQKSNSISGIAVEKLNAHLYK